MMASTSRCIASSSWLDSALRTLETMVRILLRWLCFRPFHPDSNSDATRRRPNRSRREAGAKPEVIAVPVEEGALGAVDDSCRSPMHRQLGVFLGVRLGDVRSARHLPGNRLTDGE